MNSQRHWEDYLEDIAVIKPILNEILRGK